MQWQVFTLQTAVGDTIALSAYDNAMCTAGYNSQTGAISSCSYSFTENTYAIAPPNFYLVSASGHDYSVPAPNALPLFACGLLVLGTRLRGPRRTLVASAA